MKTLQEPLIYVTRDIERAFGLPLNTPGYFIISNFTPFANSIAKGRKNVLLIKESKQLDTWELLQHPQVKQFINKQKTINILVFKNTPQIEKIRAENNWKLLNPPAELANQVEEKISQIEWLGPLEKYLPKYSILKCQNIKFKKKSFILQFNRSHTGSGTILVKNKKILEDIKKKFPEREARIAEYIEGPLFTNNNVVTNVGVMLGNISYQITGLKPFTDLPFATIGNDWASPNQILTKKQILQYKKIATDVGLRLKKAGWKGLFGIDVVMNEKNGKLYLVEINCRQPASTTYESQLQMFVISTELKRVEISLKQSKRDSSARLGMTNQLTTFKAHLMALLDMDLKNYKLIEIKDGAQIILRNKEKGIRNKGRIIKMLQKNNFNVIQYNNTEPNADLLRIQSKNGIMKAHNEFNKVGKKIAKILNN